MNSTHTQPDVAEVAVDKPPVQNHPKSKLFELVQKEGWQRPDFATTADPKIRGVFWSRAHIVARGKHYTTHAQRGRSKKEAERRAAAALLRQLSGENPAPEPCPASTFPSVNAAIRSRNFISALEILCQKRDWPIPTYDITAVGDKNNPIFRGECVLKTNEKELTVMSRGRTKRQAKHKLAENMIRRIARENIYPS